MKIRLVRCAAILNVDDPAYLGGGGDFRVVCDKSEHHGGHSGYDANGRFWSWSDNEGAIIRHTTLDGKKRVDWYRTDKVPIKAIGSHSLQAPVR